MIFWLCVYLYFGAMPALMTSIDNDIVCGRSEFENLRWPLLFGWPLSIGLIGILMPFILVWASLSCWRRSRDLSSFFPPDKNNENGDR